MITKEKNTNWDLFTGTGIRAGVYRLIHGWDNAAIDSGLWSSCACGQWNYKPGQYENRPEDPVLVHCGLEFQDAVHARDLEMMRYYMSEIEKRAKELGYEKKRV